MSVGAPCSHGGTHDEHRRPRDAPANASRAPLQSRLAYEHGERDAVLMEHVLDVECLRQCLRSWIPFATGRSTEQELMDGMLSLY